MHSFSIFQKKITMEKNTICCLITCLFLQLSIGQNKIAIKTDSGTVKINRNIYGHFAEHLGHCIYGGFYVGDTSKIPNTNGVRNDIIDALKKLKIPNLRWPGGCFAEDRKSVV